jgi:alpha-ketoglutarate-dependent taurine dioxygenase
MARLPYDIWSIRKNKNEASIVGEGVASLEQLSEFLSERGVAMPKDLSEFKKLWLSDQETEASVDSKQSAEKRTIRTVPKTTAKTSRAARSKTNIKDTSKQ